MSSNVITLTSTGNATCASSATIQAEVAKMCAKFRVKGSVFAGHSGTDDFNLFKISDGTYAGRKLYVSLHQAADSAHLNLKGWWQTANGATATGAVFDLATINQANYYIVYVSYDDALTTPCVIELYDSSGTLVAADASASNTGGALNTTAGNGKLIIGGTGQFSGTAMTVDGLAVYCGVTLSGSARWSAPSAGDSGLASGVTFDEGSGTSAANLKSGEGAFTLTSATWASGGTWDGTATSTTFYLTDAYASGSNHGALQQDGSAPADAATLTGWTVAGRAVGDFARMAYNLERGAGTFSSTAQPSGAPNNAVETGAGDCFRIGPLTGSFPAGDWNFSFAVRADSLGGTQDGRMNVRVWKSANADGSSATEITAGATALSTVTNLTTSASQNSTGTVTLGAVSLTNEYLFIQLAWEVTGVA